MYLILGPLLTEIEFGNLFFCLPYVTFIQFTVDMFSTRVWFVPWQAVPGQADDPGPWCPKSDAWERCLAQAALARSHPNRLLLSYESVYTHSLYG